ncbi:MAG: HEAT repeat domain-containing protein, partial [Pseudobdellovibrionaceae bacterium]
DNYQNFDDMNQKLQTALNTKLIKAMSVFPLVQVEGSDARMPQKFEKPYCYLASTKVSRLQKLQYIQRVLQSGQTLTVIPHIQNYMKEEIELQKSGKDTAWSNEEKNILLGLKANEKIKKDFQQLLSLRGDMYLKLRLDILNLMKSLLQVTEDEFKQKIPSVLDLKFSETVSGAKKNLICSLDIESDMVYEQIPSARWKEEDFIFTLGCLKPKNPKVHQALAEAMLKDADWGVRWGAAWALAKIKPTDSKIHQALAEAMLKDADWGVRFRAARALGEIKPSDPKIHQALAEAMLKDAVWDVRDEAAKALSEIKPADPKIHQALVEALLKDASMYVRGSAAEALGKIKPTDPKILQYLIDNKSKAKDPKQVQEVIDQLRAR